VIAGPALADPARLACLCTPIAWYLVGAALISIVAVGLTRDTRGKSLHQVDAESAARITALDNAEPATPRRGDSLA
jgi:hypothetical protein